ncbi:MAG: hypothetical protein OXT70_10770 [Chloroflexota bacterium]|nr:hypothetical protein [Chloroflexota bacterium]
MALTPAEKQRRYRERRKANMPPVHYRSPHDRRSRPQRWRDAVAVLVELQEHYAAWLDNLPENLVETALGERLQAIAELDLDALQEVELPRGYGRD